MRITTLGVIAIFATAGICMAQEFSAPVVARVEMQLKVNDQTVDVIEKGDLLTVLKEHKDSYLILTFNGHRGIVGKVNAPIIAEAVEIYDELIKESPKEGRYYTLRASAWWARGDELAALNDYDRAIEHGYREAHAYSSRGMFQAAVGNYKEAIADYTEAIAKDPKDDSYLINRAAAYMSLQDFEKAIQDYTAALKLTPKKVSTLQQRAVAWKLAGKTDEAAKDFTAALTIDPEHVPSLMGRGFLSFQAAKPKEAIVDFSKVISLNPKAADALNNRGFNRQMLAEYDKAVDDYTRAVELAPNYALAWTNMAWLLSTCEVEEIRNGRRAVEAATKACELTKYEDWNCLKALAAAFAEEKQFDTAIGWQEKTVDKCPESEKQNEQKLLTLYQQKQPYRVVAANEVSK